MIEGLVNWQGEPVVRIVLLSASGNAARYSAVIDTGFNGTLSIPESIAQRLQWKWIGYESYEIATGDVVQERVFLGRIRWFDQDRDAYVVASHAKDILIGTQLLKTHRLFIDFRSRKVRIS